ncbi:MAG: Trp family transcriptional regulator [Kiritimatiellae bacterium]|nr:Trp family transcriptional regulator [Kiritimatiellia bacterium]
MSKDALKELATVLADTHESAAMRDLLEALLTPRERARLARRWRLVCLLTSGVHQRTIARKLGISLCNITRGSRELKRRTVFRQKVSRFVRGQKKLTWAHARQKEYSP